MRVYDQNTEEAIVIDLTDFLADRSELNDVTYTIDDILEAEYRLKESKHSENVLFTRSKNNGITPKVFKGMNILAVKFSSENFDTLTVGSSYYACASIRLTGMLEKTEIVLDDNSKVNLLRSCL